jgi:hypothetical protein
VVESPPCSNDSTGTPIVTDQSLYKHFEAELRTAVSNADANALAFLVEFPLSVNTTKVSISIENASSLQGHLQDVFTPSVRKLILASPADDFFCHEEMLGYANGVLWITLTKSGYKISSVNAQTDSADTSHVPTLAFACQTKTHRILIDRQSSGVLRYRSWNTPKALTSPPDLELFDGKDRWEGTGVCALQYYTFTKGSVVIEIQKGLGCGDGSEPAKATGHLSVTISDKQVTDTWCF